MKPKKCKTIYPNKNEKLWRAYRLLSLEIEKFDQPKDVAEVRNEKRKPVPASMLPIIF